MRIMAMLVSALLLVLPIAALADAPKTTLANHGLTFVFPKGWTENAQASEQLGKVVQQAGTGGGLLYTREGKGVAMATWMRASFAVTKYRVAIESAIAAMRTEREKSGKFLKWDVSETKTRVTTRFESESPSGMRGYGIMVNAVDRDGYLLTWTAACIYGADVAKTVEPLCKTAMATFSTTMKDSELKQIEPKK